MEVTNRFKGPDLADRLSEELWMEVRNTVQEVMTKTIPKKKKCKKVQWFSKEALQIVEKRRKVKAKEKGKEKSFRVQRVKNAELQRIARRD